MGVRIRLEARSDTKTLRYSDTHMLSCSDTQTLRRSTPSDTQTHRRSEIHKGLSDASH